jgi:hypothetical protein
MEATLSRGAESGRESQSNNSEDNETTSDNSGRLKVVAVASLAGINYDFGPSTVTKTRLGSMESDARYFPKGYGRPPRVQSVPEPQANEAVVFEDFFAVGLRMLLHPVLVDIQCKFQVQLHHLKPDSRFELNHIKNKQRFPFRSNLLKVEDKHRIGIEIVSLLRTSRW